MTSTNQQIRIGTRSSRLARWQANHVTKLLGELGVEASIHFIETTGDKDRVRDFGELGAKGVFVKEIEAALLTKEIDLAVHSLKDVPTELEMGLALGAVLERAEPLDALISRDNQALDQLAEGAVVATGSLRRAAQVLAMRPDLKIGPMRGNVPTRIRKIREGEADATLLAVAGLVRLGLAGEIAEKFDPDRVTPAMGQGAVAIETREGELRDLMLELEHGPTRIAAEAERRFVATIGGGCKTPVGVIVRPARGQGWEIKAVVASPDGKSILRRSRETEGADELDEAAERMARDMYDEADDAIRATLTPAAQKR